MSKSIRVRTVEGPDCDADSVRQAERPPRRGKVMVVDDEEMMGRAVRRSLDGLHDVLVHTCARAALDTLRRGDRFDVILCDLRMPQMTGVELYREVEREWPEQALRFVFLTGDEFAGQSQDVLQRVRYLAKPFEVDDLRALVNELVQRVAGRPAAPREG